MPCLKPCSRVRGVDCLRCHREGVWAVAAVKHRGIMKHLDRSSSGAEDLRRRPTVGVLRLSTDVVHIVTCALCVEDSRRPAVKMCPKRRPHSV